MTASSPRSDRVRVRRNPARGRYDRETVHAILDATPVCHLGFVHDGHPMVIPTIHARRGEILYVHASAGSRLALAAAGATVPVCLTVTLLDGLVFARSAFHHSMNYRSVVVVGAASLVEDADERLAALRATTEAVAPGRWGELRPPTRRELEATAVLRVGLDEASAKVREGGPVDEPEDVDPAVWAGVLPLRTAAGEPVAADDVAREIPLPPSVRRQRDLLG